MPAKEFLRWCKVYPLRGSGGKRADIIGTIGIIDTNDTIGKIGKIGRPIHYSLGNSAIAQFHIPTIA